MYSLIRPDNIRKKVSFQTGSLYQFNTVPQRCAFIQVNTKPWSHAALRPKCTLEHLYSSRLPRRGTVVSVLLLKSRCSCPTLANNADTRERLARTCPAEFSYYIFFIHYRIHKATMDPSSSYSQSAEISRISSVCPYLGFAACHAVLVNKSVRECEETGSFPGTARPEVSCSSYTSAIFSCINKRQHTF